MQFEISRCAALVRRDDDAAPQLEQQPLGGGTGQGVGGDVGGRHGAGPAHDGDLWPLMCWKAGTITTKVPTNAPNQPKLPVITQVENEPPTLSGSGKITIHWVSAQYDKFLVWWTVDGQSLRQGEPRDSGTSGRWTTDQPIDPGLDYTFQVEGGTVAGPINSYNCSGWGPSVTVNAAQPLRSLVQFLRHSGINPYGLHISSIAGGETSLTKLMKLA